MVDIVQVLLEDRQIYETLTLMRCGKWKLQRAVSKCTVEARNAKLMSAGTLYIKAAMSTGSGCHATWTEIKALILVELQRVKPLYTFSTLPRRLHL